MNGNVRISTPHLAERLRDFALFLTPNCGHHAKQTPVNMPEVLRQAAERMLQISSDLQILDEVQVAKSPDWAHWSIINSKGRIVFTTSDGQAAAEQYLAFRATEGDATGKWVVRPIIFGRPATSATK